ASSAGATSHDGQSSPIAEGPELDSGQSTEQGPPSNSHLKSMSLLLRRLGPIEWGMTVEEAEKALGERLVGADDSKAYFGNPTCYYVHPESVPEGIGFMVENERIARVDIDIPLVGTRSGVRVGTREDDLLAAYPDRL